WRVDVADAEAHFRLAQEVAAVAEEALAAGRLRRSAGAERFRPLTDDESAELAARVGRMRAWDPARLAGERQRFLAAYEPVSILPPDQYNAVVLQATYGCSWNRCTFCTFYQDRPFRVREVGAFAEHVDAVLELLGRAVRGRRGVFFGDGNALVLSNARLEPLFAEVRRAMPEQPVSSFVDVFGGERKPVEAWRELASWGLTRVAVGLETGSDALLSYLNKPGSADEAAAFVATLKEAGLAVSVIVMVGAGGERFAAEHERDTAALLDRLPLGRGDLVYLSPFVVQPGTAYQARAAADGLRPLSADERAAQYERLWTAARVTVPEARTALYHIDEFVY
ncbi:MAG: radical SAM protein, partial [Deinococcales bacterium]